MSLNSPIFLPPVVLSFAGCDPTGGAGIQADLMTLSALGCHALSVVTALTVQDTVGVHGVTVIDANWVDGQARCLLQDMPVAVFKIGMLGSLDNVEMIARILSDYPAVPLVFDPVLTSGRGDALADAAMIDVIRKLLLPRTMILTPNSLEARRLVDDGRRDQAGNHSLDECARCLLAMGCKNVLLTGTHENTLRVVNDLYGPGEVVQSASWERLPGSYHGSGCTLASAVAAGLAHGLPVADAVRKAQNYTWHTLAAGFRPGAGQYVPDRFFQTRQ